MNDDNTIGGLLLGLLALVGVTYLLGHRFGYEDGIEKGKNESIVFCIEKPKECKIFYDYKQLVEKRK